MMKFLGFVILFFLISCTCKGNKIFKKNKVEIEKKNKNYACTPGGDGDSLFEDLRMIDLKGPWEFERLEIGSVNFEWEYDFFFKGIIFDPKKFDFIDQLLYEYGYSLKSKTIQESELLEKRGDRPYQIYDLIISIEIGGEKKPSCGTIMDLLDIIEGYKVVPVFVDNDLGQKTYVKPRSIRE